MFVRQTIATLTVAATTAIFAFGASSVEADQGVSPKIGADSLPHAAAHKGESRTNGLEGALSAVGDFFSPGEPRQQTAAADFDDFDWTPRN